MKLGLAEKKSSNHKNAKKQAAEAEKLESDKKAGTSSNLQVEVDSGIKTGSKNGEKTKVKAQTKEEKRNEFA